jgi:RNA polymerase sigma factor (sigma-70 family)
VPPLATRAIHKGRYPITSVIPINQQASLYAKLCQWQGASAQLYRSLCSTFDPLDGIHAAYLRMLTSSTPITHNLLAYAKVTLRNEARGELRKVKRVTLPFVELQEKLNPVAPLIPIKPYLIGEYKTLAQMVEPLCWRARRILTLTYAEDMSVKQIAQQLDLNENTVKVIRFRALRQLRRSMTQ